MKKLVYIGNNLSKKTKYTPMLVTLSELLRVDGNEVLIASSYMNKGRRLVDMVYTVIKYSRKADYVLIDTFGAFNFYFAVLISLISRICRVPYIPILRGGNLPDRFNNNPFYTKLIFENAFANVTPSNFLKVELEKKGYPAKVIPNILNIDRYKCKERVNIQPKLLYVRAFHQIYNPTMAVRVLYRLQKEFPNATLCMIGPEKDKSFHETKTLAHELGVEKSIKYTGVLSKKEWHKLSEEYDIFINTTTIDNTPVSVMEAMAMGLPVVSTNVGGIPYLLEDKKDAFLVPSNDDSAMSQTIVNILNDPISTQTIIKNARDKVEQFDWSVVGPLWKFLLESEPRYNTKNWTDKVYQKSPVFLQNMMITVYGLYWKNRRFGGRFSRYLEEFNSREAFTGEQWEEYQTQELRKLLVHAFTTVPYYREKYKAAGINKEDLEKFEIQDLKKLPYLEKEDLRKFGRSTLLSSMRGSGSFYLSSGSTGTPIGVYISKEFHQKWNAVYESRVRNWAGLNYKLPRAMIGGRRIITGPKARPPYYRYNYAESQAYFSAYHISDKTAPNYVLEMLKLNINYLVGYAMSIYLLASSISKQKLKAPKFEAVLTSSEKLTNEMRSVIEQVFQCKVYDAYSGVEACGLISENKVGELVHSPDSGIMEVLDEKGNEVSIGGSGEVVATGFLNYDQPLIRYRIGDRVKISEDQNLKSGLHMLRVEEIEGRVEDVIIGLNGQKMVRFHGIFVGINAIIMAQVIQNTIDNITIKLVVDESYSTYNESVIKERIVSQLGRVNVNFKYVEEIKKTSAGKFKAVISNIGNAE
jgi:phenylacetate-CoA ligase